SHSALVPSTVRRQDLVPDALQHRPEPLREVPRLPPRHPALTRRHPRQRRRKPHKRPHIPGIPPQRCQQPLPQRLILLRRSAPRFRLVFPLLPFVPFPPPPQPNVAQRRPRLRLLAPPLLLLHPSALAAGRRRHPHVLRYLRIVQVRQPPEARHPGLLQPLHHHNQVDLLEQEPVHPRLIAHHLIHRLATRQQPR